MKRQTKISIIYDPLSSLMLKISLKRITQKDRHGGDKLISFVFLLRNY